MSERPEPGETSEHGTWVERIAKRLPGYAGYVRQQERQASDQATRRFLQQQLQQAIGNVERAAAQLVDQGRLDAVTAVDRLRSQLLDFDAQIASALPPRAKLFQANSLDENLLEDLYDEDMRLMDLAEELLVELARADADKHENWLPIVQQKVGQLGEVWRDRHRLVTDLRRSGRAE